MQAELPPVVTVLLLLVSLRSSNTVNSRLQVDYPILVNSSLVSRLLDLDQLLAHPKATANLNNSSSMAANSSTVHLQDRLQANTGSLKVSKPTVNHRGVHSQVNMVLLPALRLKAAMVLHLNPLLNTVNSSLSKVSMASNHLKANMDSLQHKTNNVLLVPLAILLPSSLFYSSVSKIKAFQHSTHHSASSKLQTLSLRVVH